MTPPQAVLRRIADLPSETRIHLIVFCAVVLLLAAYVVGGPAYVLFSSEGRRGTALFLGIGAAVFAGAVAARRRIPWRDVEPFPQSRRAAAFHDLYVETADRVGLSGALPPLLWSYTDQRTHAQTVRWAGVPAVVVSAGLVQHARAAPDDVRAYLTHELAHVANGDLAVFEWTLGLTSGFRLLSVLTVLASATLLLVPAATDASSILFFDAPETPLFVALLLMVGTLWLVSIALGWLLVVRYAGVLTSLRELHADVRAAAWLPDGVYVATIRAARAQPRRSRIRSLLTPRLIHLSAPERVEFLEDPARVVAPKLRYFALVAALVLALQSSPFTAGIDSNVMRTAPLALWAVLAVAYLLNLQRVAAAVATIPALRAPRRLVPLAAASGFLLAVPTLRSPQLYPSVITLFSDAAGTVAVLRDEWSQWRLSWGGMAAALALSGAAVTILGMVLRKFTIAQRRVVAGACLAVGSEVLIVGLALYMSSAVTWLDPPAAFVHDHRMALAVVPALVFALVTAGRES